MLPRIVVYKLYLWSPSRKYVTTAHADSNRFLRIHRRSRPAPGVLTAAELL